MAEQWRVIDLCGFEGELRSTRGGVEVCPDGGAPTTVPVAELAVVLVGMKVNLSAAVLHRLAEADVALLFCDWRGIPEGGCYSWSDHGRVAARHRAQAEATLPRKKNAWARLVRAKIEGQASVLENLKLRGGGELLALADQVRSGDPGNIEAQAARLYWSRALGRGVSRQPAAGQLIGANACLDYGYSVLRGHLMRAVLAAGLAPALGVFHRGRGNAFALADDLIEPFRPAIDEVALQLPPTASPSDRSVKQLLVAAASQRFDGDGHGIPAVAEALAQSFGRYVEGDIDRLRVLSWQGPSSVGVGD
ncbi:type II CRISPR-associated endonuclease Cas1 [Schaalia odontolytica]|uniref:CRISPR-associated endonuclease Cas1 n=1 Tax=Schaalia odontolytica TaxID=1660 RepID=A0A2X0U0Z0_9ACTO|nr:type II CRISPR-associated endonuclease Cas1 [Schaalia odontolytica]WMS26632.1 type II CRISPR-associated endonuclease Cas1 [Schaalia odontolytica]SPT55419.1 CRISPR-associated endonuclease Cas1, subtype II/NMENI [Schaalia odontolytica]